MSIKTIVLDFDGVILESVDVKTQAYRKLFSKYTTDIEPVIEYHLKNNGLSRFIKFEHIWENFIQQKYDTKTEKLLAQEFSDIVVTEVISCPFVDGAIEFLKEFSKNVPLYVASAVPKAELEVIINAKSIGDYFAGIYGFPPVTKTQAMVEVMHKRCILPQEIIFIGDSIQDMKAAIEVGVYFIGRKNKESFNGHNITTFNDMKDIKNYILTKFRIQT